MKNGGNEAAADYIRKNGGSQKTLEMTDPKTKYGLDCVLGVKNDLKRKVRNDIAA